MSTNERCEIMVRWLDRAWNDFYAKGGKERVKKAFQRCGMLNAVDGSDDHLITVEGCPNYSLDGLVVTFNMDSDRHV